MSQRKPSVCVADIWFSGHPNEQTACVAGGKALKERVCEFNNLRHEQVGRLVRIANGCCDFESSQNGEIVIIRYMI